MCVSICVSLLFVLSYSGLFVCLVACLFSKEIEEERVRIWVGQEGEEVGEEELWSEYIVWKKKNYFQFKNQG